MQEMGHQSSYGVIRGFGRCPSCGHEERFARIGGTTVWFDDAPWAADERRNGYKRLEAAALAEAESSRLPGAWRSHLLDTAAEMARRAEL